MNYLYLIREVPTGISADEEHLYVKIGISENPKERLKQLQTSNPRPLSLEAIMPITSAEPTKIESQAHQFLKDYRVSKENLIP